MLSASLSSLIRAKRSVLLLVCVSTLVLYTFYNNIASWSLSQTKTRAETEELLEGEFKSCPNVISRMVVGHWVRHKDYSKKEMTLVDDALRKTLRHNKIPGVLERKDKRCGNVDLEGNPYYRALCEPEGETPCCFSYTCVNKTIYQCQGPWALDVRQVFQAEFATWIPDDPTCKMLDLRSEKQICQVLDNVTIYFVGESLTRMLYMSLLGLLRDQKYETHILIDNSTIGSISIFFFMTTPQVVYLYSFSRLHHRQYIYILFHNSTTNSICIFFFTTPTTGSISIFFFTFPPQTVYAY
uniref:Uncharacterized protein n=1 Tax=Biomphalaria glabrata TaxID=6526 RepID=A0A2C9LMZ2_BIOGL